MSDPTPVAAQSTPTTPQPAARNPLEKMLVWGLILVGIVVVVIEGRARIAYGVTESRIVEALKAAEEQETSDFTIDKLSALLAGSPTETEEQSSTYDIRHLEWNGLAKQYRLHVQYGKHSRLVTSYTTDNPPAEEPAVREPAPDDEPLPTGPQMGGGGGPGGGGFGGGPRPDPMESDADGDGKLSREEVPGRMAEFFDAIDANSDGFIDAAELEARRNQRGGRGGGPGGGFGPPSGDGAGTGRRRPEADVPADESATATPAPADEPATIEEPANPVEPATECPATDGSAVEK